MSESPPLVLVTGASGYVGGRLVPALLAAGARVRAGGRTSEKMEHRTWAADVELVELDLGEREQVRRALDGVDVVVFLVHAMGGGKGYADREARMARIMAEEADRAGVERIVYLSGLHPDLPEDRLSEHMASRERVARILGEGPVPALVLRAATVIGAGSASFEIIRHLGDVLPVMPVPAWVTNRIEPLAVADVLHYLVAGVMTPDPIDGGYAVGSGESHLRFADLLTEYAVVAGLARRTVIPLPIPAPRLSGLWIALVTPVPRTIAMPLAASMQHEAVSHGSTIDEVLPAPEGGATPYREAVAAALAQYRTGSLADLVDAERAEALGPGVLHPTDPAWAGLRRRVIQEQRALAPGSSPGAALRRLAETGSPLLAPLTGRRGWWTAEPDAPRDGATLHHDGRRERRTWLAVGTGDVDGDGSDAGTVRLRLIGVPEGLLGRALWWARRPRRVRALQRLADELARTDPGAPAGGARP